MAAKKLADVALKRATEGKGERKPGYCQRWARQCVQAALGSRYDAWWRGEADETAAAFLTNPPPGAQVIRSRSVSKTRLGDLLYCTTGHGGQGHVGIRVLGNRVAENSVRKSGRTHGAIGFCPLGEFGFDVIVRLPQ